MRNQNMRIAVLQMNACTGDLQGNALKIESAALKAAEDGADILLTPLYALTGPVSGDLLKSEEFLKKAHTVLRELAQRIGSKAPIAVLVGTVRATGAGCCLTMALIEKSEVTAYCDKSELVGRERKDFVAGVGAQTVSQNGVTLGVLMGTDCLNRDTVRTLKKYGADAIVIADAREFLPLQSQKVYGTVAQLAKQESVAVSYVNLVGGHDSRLFDGSSFVVSAEGFATEQLKDCEEDYCVSPLFAATRCRQTQFQSAEDERLRAMYRALVLAVRDYVHKNGFRSVVLGLSGGVDSALVATIAVDALGADNVWSVMMPTRFTTDLSLTEAKKLAIAQGIHYTVRPIGTIFDAYRAALAEDFDGLAEDLTEENLQARIRGTLLMAFANKFGHLVLATGNKSESAVGYCTLYGDTVGAFAPIQDVLKTDVWNLCRWRNAQSARELIPAVIIERAPSAELHEGQTDEQSLPQYALLDQIIRLYVEERKSVQEIISSGLDPEQVQWVVRKIHQSEYKRSQCAPGPKLSKRAFANGWDYPLTAKTVVG